MWVFMSLELINRAKEERKFLHDMANQITILQGMHSLIASDLEEKLTDRIKINERMQKANTSINKMTDLLKNRRNIIIKEQSILEEKI